MSLSNGLIHTCRYVTHLSRKRQAISTQQLMGPERRYTLVHFQEFIRCNSIRNLTRIIKLTVRHKKKPRFKPTIASDNLYLEIMLYTTFTRLENTCRTSSQDHTTVNGAQFTPNFHSVRTGDNIIQILSTWAQFYRVFIISHYVGPA